MTALSHFFSFDGIVELIYSLTTNTYFTDRGFNEPYVIITKNATFVSAAREASGKCLVSNTTSLKPAYADCYAVIFRNKETAINFANEFKLKFADEGDFVA